MPSLLALPVELRSIIYSFAVDDSPAITIAAADHKPVVHSGYDSSLLSGTGYVHGAPIRTAGDSWARPYATFGSLLLVNKKVHAELQSDFGGARRRRTSLFVQYPCGLDAAREALPHLMHQAKDMHLAGRFVAMSSHPSRPSDRVQRIAPPEPWPHEKACLGTAALLGQIIGSCFGPSPRHGIEKLELRIYCPGHDSYIASWADDCSPVSIALREVYSGRVEIEVSRGDKGTGFHIVIERSVQSGRTLTFCWRKLREGQGIEPQEAVGRWIVDPTWPHTTSTFA